ncbi:MAG: hypothetical protein AABW50_02550 [Nanoarchaeota archaeon]
MKNIKDKLKKINRGVIKAELISICGLTLMTNALSYSVSSNALKNGVSKDQIIQDYRKSLIIKEISDGIGKYIDFAITEISSRPGVELAYWLNE